MIGSKIAGRMCLDQWGGNYASAAVDIDRAARYGLTHAVFVKHVWQRWGYDYRLPDIYPPAGNADDFQAMADACARAGILFARGPFQLSRIVLACHVVDHLSRSRVGARMWTPGQGRMRAGTRLPQMPLALHHRG